jgi:hypothetical protein
MVAAITTQQAKPLVVIGSTGQAVPGVVTDLKVDQSVAAQFQSSLDRAIYVVPFGDNMGNMEVSMLLNRGCDNRERLDEFFRYYSDKRLGPKTLDPVTVTIGAQAFRAYLVGMSVSVSANDFIYRGTATFAAWIK